MSETHTNGWLESIPVRMLVLAPVAAGAYFIYMRLPALLDPTPLTDFPIVTTVLALFAYLTVVHLVLNALSAVARLVAGSKPA